MVRIHFPPAESERPVLTQKRRQGVGTGAVLVPSEWNKTEARDGGLHHGALMAGGTPCARKCRAGGSSEPALGFGFHRHPIRLQATGRGGLLVK
jgi:hypothetical protein